MTDLQLLDKFCDECLDYINPFLYNEIRQRGLAWIVNYLPNNIQEAKVVIRAKLAKSGKYVGDPEIEQIADVISRVEFLKKKLNNCNIADIHVSLPIVEEIKTHLIFLQNYYKT